MVLAFDGIEIANDGTVPFRTGERIAFSYLISNKVGRGGVGLLLGSNKAHAAPAVLLAHPVVLHPCTLTHTRHPHPAQFVGDDCVLRVLRRGEVLEVRVALSKPAALVPPHISNRDPSYFICGGLVFTAVCEPYLQSEYGSDYATDSPVKLLDRLYHGMPK